MNILKSQGNEKLSCYKLCRTLEEWDLVLKTLDCIDFITISNLIDLPLFSSNFSHVSLNQAILFYTTTYFIYFCPLTHKGWVLKTPDKLWLLSTSEHQVLRFRHYCELNTVLFLSLIHSNHIIQRMLFCIRITLGGQIFSWCLLEVNGAKLISAS